MAIVAVAALLGVSEAMTPEEETEVLATHNELRRRQGATGMEEMVSAITYFSHTFATPDIVRR